MKKVAAAAVSIGVILVIVGLVLVGIFGGDALRNGNWTNIVNGMNHDLESANIHRDYSESELPNIVKVDVNVNCYSVYVLPSETNALSVRYVDPLEKGVTIDAGYDKDTLTFSVTETDDISFNIFGGLFTSNRFIVIYVPQTERFVQSSLNINASTAGIKVQNIKISAAKCVTDTGSVNIDGGVISDLYAETKTGAINVQNLSCYVTSAKTNTGAINLNQITSVNNVVAETGTGAINCNVTSESVTIDAKTGAVNFKVKAKVIKIETDTGAINGTVLGNKNDYDIDVYKGTGWSNIEGQKPGFGNSDKRLYVKVATGSININFDNN